MGKLFEIEVDSSEKEHAVQFLKKQGFIIQLSFIGSTWWSKEVYKITWFSSDAYFDSSKGLLLEHLRDIRQHKP